MEDWKLSFLCVKVLQLHFNKNLEISNTSLEEWKYGRMKVFFHKTHFINSSLEPFIHACFSEIEFYISILPYFHSSILVKKFWNESIAAYLRGRFLKE